MYYILPLLLLLLMCSQSQSSETGNTEGNHLESPQSEGNEPGESLVIERIERESVAKDNRSVLLARKRHYFLPVTYAENSNNELYEIDGAERDELLDEFEVRQRHSIDPIPQSIAQYFV